MYPGQMKTLYPALDQNWLAKIALLKQENMFIFRISSRKDRMNIFDIFWIKYFG